MRRSALVMCLALVGLLAARAGGASDARTSDAIRTSCAGEAELLALYAPGDATPLWLDAQGALLLPGMDAVRLLSFAADEGLEPGDYGVDALRALLQASAAAPEPETVAHADVALSREIGRASCRERV